MLLGEGSEGWPQGVSCLCPVAQQGPGPDLQLSTRCSSLVVSAPLRRKIPLSFSCPIPSLQNYTPAQKIHPAQRCCGYFLFR